MVLWFYQKNGSKRHEKTASKLGFGGYKNHYSETLQNCFSFCKVTGYIKYRHSLEIQRRCGEKEKTTIYLVVPTHLKKYQSIWKSSPNTGQHIFFYKPPARKALSTSSRNGKFAISMPAFKVSYLIPEGCLFETFETSLFIQAGQLMICFLFALFSVFALMLDVPIQIISPVDNYFQDLPYKFQSKTRKDYFLLGPDMAALP